MLTNIFKYKDYKLFSLFLISALTFSLFYTGNNTVLFTASYLSLVFCLVIILKQRFSNPISIPINGILISSSLLLLWFAISIFSSQIKYLSIYNFFWVGSLIIVFLLFTFNENKDEVWKGVWPAILLLVLIWACYGLVQYYYLHVPTNASFLNRNSLAALVNLALIPAAGYFLLKEENRPWKFLNNKILSLALIVLFLITFIITSRGGSLSLAFGFITLLFFFKKHIEKQQFYSLLVIIFISFLIAILSQYFISDAGSTLAKSNFAERMMTLKDTSTAGNTRFIIWKSLLPLFQDMPWYGFGLGSLWAFWPPYRPASDTSAGFFAHNDYMQLTIEAGYPAIVLLVLLFVFLLRSFLLAINNNEKENTLSVLQQVELVSLFSALLTFAAHSFLTYNFYILPLLIIAGLYLARVTQLLSIGSITQKTFRPLSTYFKLYMFLICLIGSALILSTYFISISLSSYYNLQAKELMRKNKFQDSNAFFLKAQTLAPLMDNPFFSHADLLRRGANQLFGLNKTKKADTLIEYAHQNLDKAESLNPRRPQVHHIRGLIFERKAPEKALIEYQKALKLDPRFLFSRIRLAKILHDQKQLKAALKVLYEGVDYNYPIDKAMLDYMRIFARYSREAGVVSFAMHLEANIKKFLAQNRQK